MESSQLSRKLRRMSNEGGLALTADKDEGDKLASGLVRGIKDKLKGAKVPLGCSQQFSLVPAQTSVVSKHFCLPRIPEGRVWMENTGKGQQGQKSGPGSRITILELLR